MAKVELDFNYFKADAEKFKRWYNAAPPKSWYVYHHGQCLTKDLALKLLKDEVWNLACEGRVYLFQQRDKENPGFFFYKAQKASRKIPKLTPMRGSEDGK